MIKNTNVLVALFSLLVFSSVVSAQIVIDDFSDGDDVVVFAPDTTASQTTSGPGILGGQREDTINLPAGMNSFMGILGFGGPNGIFEIGQGSLDEISGGLVYNALGPTDLTDGGALNAFELAFTGTDQPTPILNALEISVTSGGTTVSQPITVPGSGDLTAPVVVDFFDFVGINFGVVDSLSLNFDTAGNAGRDFQLDSFTAIDAVPEPGSLALLSMASLILLRRRRM